MNAPAANREVLAFLASLSRDLIAQEKRPVRIGIAGSQGSGKSTLAAAWARADPKVAHFSLDDVYLTTNARKALAAEIAPILKTRGPPGTHDLDLATRVLAQLAAARARDATPLPRFDKLADAPIKAAQWPLYTGTANVVLVEGWCLGALPEPAEALAAPINAVEAELDPAGKARAYANTQLEAAYAKFFARFDAIVYLAAPDFEVVPRWRLEQEAGLRGVAVEALPADIRANIERFCAHFERTTRAMLAGLRTSAHTIALDENREPFEIREGL
jgi:D-glycerate 3-kinase